MSRKEVFAGLALALLVLYPAAAKEKQHSGYLQAGQVDILSILPPAPVVGDPRYDSDRAMFRKTRALVGSPRWDLAVNDVQWGNERMFRNFSCALGIVLTPANAPKISALLDRAGRDTQRETNIAKDTYKRQRPFKIDSGQICQPEADLADSYDYPSGHTTGGWTWALVLSDVAPERASAIMARGRAYGESRIVCGAHNASAVDAGRLSATVTMTVVRDTKDYKRDLAAARAEWKTLRAAGTAAQPAVCEAEKALISQSIFAP